MSSSKLYILKKKFKLYLFDFLFKAVLFKCLKPIANPVHLCLECVTSLVKCAVCIKMVNTVQVNANHGRDLHPLANHMTKLQNFTKGENRDFSAFRFSLHLMLE